MIETSHQTGDAFGISPLNGSTADILHVEASFLCADVVRFTAMTRRLGDQGSFVLMRRVARLVQAEAIHRGGTVVEVRGDSFLLTLPHPQDALQCARATYAALAEDAAAHADGGVEVRMAIHAGPAIRIGDQVFGLSVILAYRLLALVNPGQIAITQEADAQAGWALPHLASARRSFLPKGFPEEVAFRVMEAGEGAPVASTRTNRSATKPRLERVAAPQIAANAS
jgi:class 3 adenylate cyclase